MFVYRTLLSVSNIIGLGTFSVWGGYCWTFSLEEDFFSSLEFGWKVRFFLLDFRELDFRELTKNVTKKRFLLVTKTMVAKRVGLFYVRVGLEKSPQKKSNSNGKKSNCNPKKLLDLGIFR